MTDSFEDMLLPTALVRSLREAGFTTPSRVQREVIPRARSHRDLIVQSHSGSGKTLAFGLVALERVMLSATATALVLCPTREIAVQIYNVLQQHVATIAPHTIGCVIGGTPLKQDKAMLNQSHCRILIGTPGRLLHLFQLKLWPLRHVDLVVLDETDQLLYGAFLEQTSAIYTLLPLEQLQTMALSATMTPYILDILSGLMKDPMQLLLSSDAPTLDSIHQYSYTVASPEAKFDALLQVLSRIPFYQCIVFSNYTGIADDIARMLEHQGWPALCIAGGHDQGLRSETMEQLKLFNIRILVSTDLIARGVDVNRVSLVVNLDLPQYHDTYLHRIGRCGRYGSQGIAVSIVTTQEKVTLERFSTTLGRPVPPLPERVNPSHIMSTERLSNSDVRQQQQFEQQRVQIQQQPQQDLHVQRSPDTTLFPFNHVPWTALFPSHRTCSTRPPTALGKPT